MRRALLILALAAPALVQAQTVDPGEILFAEGDDIVRGPFISKAECDARGTTDVELTWRTTLPANTTSLPASSQYQVYAANRPHDATPEACHTGPNTTTGLLAGSVGNVLTASTVTQTQLFKVGDFLAAAMSPVTCAPTGDTIIYVCVQTRASNQNVGIARGTLTLSVRAPVSPGGVSAAPGDGSLSVRWTRPDSSPEIYDARVVAKSVVAGCADASNPASTCARDPRDTAVHEGISALRATEREVGGLVNDVLYRVEVYSRSEAGNENATPGTSTGTPLPSDTFWEHYRKQPGAVEEGGCGTGGAGTLALAAVGCLLAVLRRRK